MNKSILLQILLLCAFSQLSPKYESCETETCRKAAEDIIARSDLRADPCNDFYTYACGGTGKDDFTFTQATNILTERLLGLLEDTDNSLLQDPLWRFIPKLWDDCMDYVSIGEIDWAPVLKVFDEIGLGSRSATTIPASNKAMMSRKIAKFHRYFSGKGSVFTVEYFPQMDNNYGSLMLTLDSSFFERWNSDDFDTNLENYNEILRENSRSTILDTDSISFRDTLDNILSFTPDDEDECDYMGSYTAYIACEMKDLIKYTSLQKLQEDITIIDWSAYLLELLQVDVLPDNPVFFINKDFVRFVSHSSSFLGPIGIDNVLSFDFFTYTMNIVAEDVDFPEFKPFFPSPKPREMDLQANQTFCIEQFFERGPASWLFVRPYVDRYFPQESIDRLKTSFEQIRTEFINGLPWWMDSSTRSAAREKALGMEINIGFPEWFLDSERLATFLRPLVESLDNQDNSHVSNFLRINRHFWDADISKPFIDDDSRNQWSFTDAFGTFEFNAFYNPVNNEFYMLLGILVPPFWDLDYPDVLLYSTIFYVVGHEFTHAFDSGGREFDALGDPNGWWTDNDVEDFNSRAQCFVDSYPLIDIELTDGTIAHVNGSYTLNENIADSGGTTFSFAAFMRSTTDHRVLKDIDLNFMQLYFLVQGQCWCGPVDAEFDPLDDPHSVQAARVIGMVQNNRYFKDAFRCSPGSQMNPVQRCHIWDAEPVEIPFDESIGFEDRNNKCIVDEFCVSSPGWPNHNYPSNLSCEIITLIPGNFVLDENFKLEQGYDILTISDGTRTWSLSGRDPGRLPDPWFLPRYSSITFTSDDRMEVTGFRLCYASYPSNAPSTPHASNPSTTPSTKSSTMIPTSAPSASFSDTVTEREKIMGLDLSIWVVILLSILICLIGGLACKCYNECPCGRAKILTRGMDLTQIQLGGVEEDYHGIGGGTLD